MSTKGGQRLEDTPHLQAVNRMPVSERDSESQPRYRLSLKSGSEGYGVVLGEEGDVRVEGPVDAEKASPKFGASTQSQADSLSKDPRLHEVDLERRSEEEHGSPLCRVHRIQHPNADPWEQVWVGLDEAVLKVDTGFRRRGQAVIEANTELEKRNHAENRERPVFFLVTPHRAVVEAEFAWSKRVAGRRPEDAVCVSGREKEQGNGSKGQTVHVQYVTVQSK